MINKIEIYDSFLMLAEHQKEMIINTLKITDIFITYFKGCKDSKNKNNCNLYIENNTTDNQETNTYNNLSLNFKTNQGKENMKFKGKTIFKNKKCNTWYTRYRENGKQYYISGKTQAEVLKELKLRLNNKPIPKNVTTLKMWYEQWLELFKINKVKNETLKDYNKTLKNLNEQIFNKNIKQITSIEVIKNINEITKERTKQKLYELLKALFDKAKLYNIVNNNIMDIIEKPKHIRQQGIALTNEEQIKLINYCDTYIYGDLFKVTLFQGLRVGEVLAITGNDIDIENKKLIINKSLNEDGSIDTTKNIQSNRIMPIFNNTLEILKKYKNKNEERIFNFGYNIPQKHLKKIISTINIRDISPHDLRHTFITNCKNLNIPEHIIQHWIGHRIGSKITSQIYTHYNEKDTLLYLEKYNKNL